MRPLEHIEDQTVLATGYLHTWQHGTDDTAILLKHIDVLDYQSKKPAAPRLDHIWLWVTRGCWQTLESLNWVTSERFLLHEPVNFVGRVRRYTRSDGTQDLGVRLTNSFPVTIDQQATIRKAHQQQAKKMTQFSTEALLDKYLSLEIYRREFDHQIADWRDFSDRSYRDARSLLMQNISSNLGVLRGRQVEPELIVAYLEVRGEDSWRQIEERRAA